MYIIRVVLLHISHIHLQILKCVSRLFLEKTHITFREPITKHAVKKVGYYLISGPTI